MRTIFIIINYVWELTDFMSQSRLMTTDWLNRFHVWKLQNPIDFMYEGNSTTDFMCERQQHHNNFIVKKTTVPQQMLFVETTGSHWFHVWRPQDHNRFHVWSPQDQNRFHAQRQQDHNKFCLMTPDIGRVGNSHF